jgi:hypothetical protein
MDLDTKLLGKMRRAPGKNEMAVANALRLQSLAESRTCWFLANLIYLMLFSGSKDGNRLLQICGYETVKAEERETAFR